MFIGVPGEGLGTLVFVSAGGAFLYLYRFHVRVLVSVPVNMSDFFLWIALAQKEGPFNFCLQKKECQ